MCWTSLRSGCTSATTSGCSAPLKRLRDLGNSVIVVEHDEDAIREADYVVDIGPGAGIHGGKIIAQGTPGEVMANPKSLTGDYLTGRKQVAVPAKRRQPQKGRS